MDAPVLIVKEPDTMFRFASLIILKTVTALLMFMVVPAKEYGIKANWLDVGGAFLLQFPGEWKF
jgi:hypothetical protein